jgi:Bacterial pre-peptidase C-terminal domain
MFRQVLRWSPLHLCWLIAGLNTVQVNAQTSLPSKSPPSSTSNISPVYTPIPLILSNDSQGTLTDRDIPLGDGGFARDYAVQLNAGDQVAIDLTSDNFDPIVLLMTKDGKTIGKNDDGPDGTSNSLLFARIKKTGTYTVRVQGFSETSGGNFTLRVNRLQATP